MHACDNYYTKCTYLSNINETETIITNTSTTDSLEEFLNSLEKAFGDHDHARTAHTRLHDLKMTPMLIF